MKTNVRQLEANKVVMTVELDPPEFDKALEEAFRHIANEVRIPGFRPGKAPRQLIEARVGVEAARKEALRESLPTFYSQAVQEADLDVIAPPDIDIKSGEEVGPVVFDATVEIRPVLNLSGYDRIKIVVPSPAVTDEDLSRQIDRLRGQYGELNPVTRPARNGDHLTLDIKGYRHDETIEALTTDDFMYELGSKSFIAELDDQLQGAKAGDIFKFNAQVPNDEEVSFQVLVKDVKEKILPEATDEWAADASEFSTLDELKGDIRSRLEEVKRVQTRMAFQDETVKALVELVNEDIPEALIQAEMQHRLRDLVGRLQQQGANVAQYLEATGQTETDFTTRITEEATEAVKADLALRAVAHAQKIEGSDADLDAKIEGLAAELKQKPKEVRRQLERADQMSAVRSDIEKAKAFEWLLEHVEVVDEEGNKIERQLVLPDGESEGAA